MKSRSPTKTEIDELRELIAAERKRMRAERALLDATADAHAYREAFKHFLEVLPEGSPLVVTACVPKHKRH